MRQMKITLISIICLAPFTALAHGEEALVPVFMQIISLIGFIILMIFLKMNITNKRKLSVVYVVSLSLIVFFTRDLPYDLNRKFLDISWSAGPAIITLIAYLIILSKGTKSVKDEKLL